MRAEDKRKLLTPDVEPMPRGDGSGFYFWLAGLILASLIAAVATDSIVVDGLFFVLATLGLLTTYIELLHRLDRMRFGRWADKNRRFAIVVTSDSPKWHNHIKENWLARFGEHVSVLNYSLKREWPQNIESKCVNRFTRYRGNHPIVIIPRKTGEPAVYSFHAAFIAAYHGDDDALRKMEAQLFKEYAEWQGGD